MPEDLLIPTTMKSHHLVQGQTSPSSGTVSLATGLVLPRERQLEHVALLPAELSAAPGW